MSTAPWPMAADIRFGWSDRVTQGRKLPAPGPIWGSYPIRDAPEFPGSFMAAWARASLAAPASPGRLQTSRFVRQVRHHSQSWGASAGDTLERALPQIRAQLAVQGFEPGSVAQAMAAVAVVIQRHRVWQVYDEQLMGAWYMLGRRLIEMATGEGKTITVVLAAATAALAGVPVHVLTSNDYLAQRDAQQWQAVYETLGLSVAFVLASSTPAERQHAYQHDVVYVSAKEVAFDHLRDTVARAQGRVDQRVLRGLCMAIVDEADSVLIDEACTPLILSQTVDAAQAMQNHRLALYLAKGLKPRLDFLLADQQPIRLTSAGEQRLDVAAAHLEGSWQIRRFRQEQVVLALTALHALKPDVHYLCRDKEVHIIDGHSGRLALGRVWSAGLHQMVCLKEGLPPAAQTQTLLQTTYQVFFPRYHFLCGLSGTVKESRAELMAVYRLPVVSVPLHRPKQRSDLGLMLCESAQARWQQVATRASEQASLGRPVLIGVDSVADSEALSLVLTQMGQAHQVLNARDDGMAGERERQIIATAGLSGVVTVATAMAGRGTDIQPETSALRSGGLHVICAQWNSSARVDRQLFGRTGRQGQPGSHERILSWQDETLANFGAWRLWRHWHRWPGLSVLTRHVLALIQAQAGRQACRQRWDVLQTHLAMKNQTTLAGRDDWT